MASHAEVKAPSNPAGRLGGRCLLPVLGLAGCQHGWIGDPSTGAVVHANEPSPPPVLLVRSSQGIVAHEPFGETRTLVEPPLADVGGLVIDRTEQFISTSYPGESAFLVDAHGVLWQHPFSYSSYTHLRADGLVTLSDVGGAGIAWVEPNGTLIEGPAGVRGILSATTDGRQLVTGQTIVDVGDDEVQGGPSALSVVSLRTGGNGNETYWGSADGQDIEMLLPNGTMVRHPRRHARLRADPHGEMRAVLASVDLTGGVRFEHVDLNTGAVTPAPAPPAAATESDYPICSPGSSCPEWGEDGFIYWYSHPQLWRRHEDRSTWQPFGPIWERTEPGHEGSLTVSMADHRGVVLAADALTSAVVQHANAPAVEVHYSSHGTFAMSGYRRFRVSDDGEWLAYDSGQRGTNPDLARTTMVHLPSQAIVAEVTGDSIGWLCVR